MSKVSFYFDNRSKKLFTRCRHDYKKFESFEGFDQFTEELLPAKIRKTKKREVKISLDDISGTSINAVQTRDQMSYIKNLLESKIPSDYFAAYGNNPTVQDLKKSFLLFVKKGSSEIKEANTFSEKKKLLSFFEVYQEYIEYRRKHSNVSEHTIGRQEVIMTSLKEFIESKNAKLTFEDIDVRFYDEYIYYLRNEYELKSRNNKKVKKKGLADNTIGSYIKKLKQFLNWANKHGYTTHQGHVDAHFKAINKPADIVVFTEQEFKALINLKLGEEDNLSISRDIVVAGCCLGLRIHDLLTITEDKVFVNDFNKSQSFIEIVPSKTHKSGKKVRIPLAGILVDIIEKYEGKYDYVLPTHYPNGNRVVEQTLNDDIKKLCLAIGMTQVEEKRIAKNDSYEVVKKPRYELFSCHRMRASFITLMLKAGVPAEQVMEMSGHSDWNSFKRYVKFSSEDNSSAISATFDKFQKVV